MHQFLTHVWRHTAAVLTFLVLSCIYFFPQTEGKVLQQSDHISWQGMSEEIRQFREKTGTEPLWTNAMFGGMPTYQINTQAAGNQTRWIERASTLFINRPIGMFFSLMLGFYILMCLLGVNPWLSMLGGIAFGFTTNQLVLFEAGHFSKIRVISFFAMTTAGIILAYRKKILAGTILFASGLAVQLFANHIQMTYYLLLCMVVYVIIRLIMAAKEKTWSPFLKASGALGIGVVLAMASSAAHLWMTYEYSKDTMRGDPILEVSSDSPQSSSETSGLDWEYAMRWSNGLLDIAAGLVPGVVGGSGGERVDKSSAIARDLQRKGVQLPKDLELPLYWGDLPFTSGPAYFGAGIVFLFILGLLIVKGPIKWWLAISCLLTILLSMGKNAGILSEIFFNYIPLYNKFRAPSSILAVTSFLLPILSILALAKVIGREEPSEDLLKNLKIAGGITAGICLLLALAGPSLFSFSGESDAQLVQSGLSLEALIEDRKSLLRADAFRSLAIVLVFMAVIWFYLKKKLGKILVISVLGLTTLIDLWGIGKRYINTDSFQEESRVASLFEPRPVDQQIMSMEPHRGAYRVLDLSVNTFNSSHTSYFHNTIGGYHAAKLQRYQDLIDRHITRNNIAVLNMLNTKYIIAANGELRVNDGALGNAWFVDEVKIVPTANAEVDALNDFDPAVTSFVHQEFADKVPQTDPDKGGTISLTSYAPDHLVYTARAPSDQFAVFSEIWYGPDKGWQAYLDGKPVDHIRANYVLRALPVPAGQHEIEFKFRPKSYYQGKPISLVASIFLLLSLFLFLAKSVYDAWQKFQAQDQENTKHRRSPKSRDKKPGS